MKHQSQKAIMEKNLKSHKNKKLLLCLLLCITLRMCDIETLQRAATVNCEKQD